MIIFNTTFSVDDSVAGEWPEWVVSFLLPQYYDTGIFVKHVFSKILVQDEAGGESFSLQLFAPNMLMLQTFIDNHESKIDSLLYKQFKDKVLFFKTLMAVRDMSASL